MVDLLDNAMGPIGGLFSVGVGSGFMIGWAFSQKTAVERLEKQLGKTELFYMTQIEKLEAVLRQSEVECHVRITALETRLKEVEENRLKIAMGRRDSDI